MIDNQIEFRGTIVRCVYSSPTFKTYACDVSKRDYPNIKFNKFNNVSIIGDMSDLVVGVEYEITAIEEQSKYGISYRVTNIRRDVPTSADDAKAFLEEILTYNQAQVLFENYPNIIELVKNNEADKVDLTRLHGIGAKTFEVIKRKIIENFKLADLVGEFKGVLSLSMLRRIYAEYPDIDALRAKLREEPYKTLTRISGVGYKTADSIVLDLQKENIVDFGYDVKTSYDRCLACIIYILKENESDGNTCMNLADLRKQCLDMIPSCVNHFVNAIKSDDIYYDKLDMSVGLARTYEAERYIADVIAHSLDTVPWDYDVEKYRMAGEFALLDEQIDAIRNVCRYNVSILNGPAGTGKSQTTLGIIKMLEDNGKEFALMAPTGKASKVLSEYTGKRATTIHRGLCYNPREGWFYNNDNKLPYDIVIVDEASMIDVALFRHLVEAIDFETTRLLLIGDNAQLPSVGCGNLLHDFMTSKVIPSTTLTKVFRYGDGGISKVATDTGFCKPYLDKSMKSKATQFGKNKDYVFVDVTPESIPMTVVGMVKKLIINGNDIGDIQVLTAKNVGPYGTVVLNNEIQKAVNKNCGNGKCMRVGDTSYYDGDIVLQKANNYNATMCDDNYKAIIGIDDKPMTAFVANGETGRVVCSCKDYIVIDFDGILVRYDKSDMCAVGLGYAISIHKSQGSGIKNVIICTPQSDMFMLNSNLLYVAITRTKSKCYHLGNIASVNKAVKKKANLTRHTFMQKLLSSANRESA